MENHKRFIPKTTDLQAIPYQENGERLVNLAERCADFLCDYRRKDSGLKNILVRETIVDKLKKVQKRLTLHDAKMQLLIVEGYRSLSYQEDYFLKQLVAQYQQDPSKDFKQLIEEVHHFVALPSVAGHPTGGAIDLTIAYEGEEIDMGGKIADFSHPEKLPTYSSFVTKEQTQGRLLLHDVMIAEGFAAFYGEWWHFSYGDREWAFFYNMPEAFYAPLFA